MSRDGRLDRPAAAELSEIIHKSGVREGTISYTARHTHQNEPIHGTYLISGKGRDQQMKKPVAILLALVLVFALSAPAMAETTISGAYVYDEDSI